MAQPIAGLTHVVFDTNTITGSDVGTLSAKKRQRVLRQHHPPTATTWPT